MSDKEKWLPTKNKSYASMVIRDSNGTLIRDGGTDRKYDKRKHGHDEAAEYLLELAKYIELGAGETVGEKLAAPFRRYAREISNGVHPKIAAKNFTHELGITTNNKRPKPVTDDEIIGAMEMNLINHKDEKGNEINACGNITQAYKKTADELEVSKAKVIEAWKKHKQQCEEDAIEGRRSFERIIELQEELKELLKNQ